MNYKLFQNYIQDKKSGGICGKNTDAFLSTEKWTEYLLSFHQNRKIKQKNKVFERRAYYEKNYK